MLIVLDLEVLQGGPLVGRVIGNPVTLGSDGTVLNIFFNWGEVVVTFVCIFICGRICVLFICILIFGMKNKITFLTN